jgi:epoxyqueuosine reductase
MTIGELTERLKVEALRLGFDQVGIAPAAQPPGYPEFLEWLSAGNAAGMEYLHRQEPSRSHPGALLDGVRSVVMVSIVYGTNPREAEATSEPPTAGKVARYARCADYHRVLWDKLGRLLDWLRTERPEARGRAVADTAPLLERDYARVAGLGWIGKNTMLLSRRLGSFTFLGALLTDVELAYDPPHASQHCGTCTRCLDACPTDAFAAPYVLDSRRCISYWTIEHRGPIPDHAAGQLHGWVFGCDICQDVCPWNRKAPSGRDPALMERPEWVGPDLLGWLADDGDSWRARLKGTAAARAKRAGLLRNAALVVGTRGVVEAVGPLAALLDDRQEDPVVRSAAAWALARIAGEPSRAALARHRDDPDPSIRHAARETGDPTLEPSDAGSPQSLDSLPARLAADTGRDV